MEFCSLRLIHAALVSLPGLTTPRYSLSSPQRYHPSTHPFPPPSQYIFSTPLKGPPPAYRNDTPTAQSVHQMCTKCASTVHRATTVHLNPDSIFPSHPFVHLPSFPVSGPIQSSLGMSPCFAHMSPQSHYHLNTISILYHLSSVHYPASASPTRFRRSVFRESLLPPNKNLTSLIA